MRGSGGGGVRCVCVRRRKREGMYLNYLPTKLRRR